MTTSPEVDLAVYENLLVEHDEGFVTITINRPRVLNALSRATVAELHTAVDSIAGDDSIRAVVITGSGRKAFVSGADIGELEALETAQQGFEHSKYSHELLFKLRELSKAVIMAVNGYALGGGCELALGGDIIIASENAQFGQPEVNLGIIPGFGGTQRLPRLVGRTKALEMILTGEHISADEAERIGLVNRVVPQDQLMPAAEAMAATIAAKAPLAIGLAKQAVYEGLEVSPREGNELEMKYFGRAVATEDRREGTLAFLEKRKPNWQGK